MTSVDILGDQMLLHLGLHLHVCVHVWAHVCLYTSSNVWLCKAFRRNKKEENPVSQLL